MTPAYALAAAALVVLLSPVLSRLMGKAAGWPLAAGLVGVAALVHAAYRPGDTHTQELPWIPSADIMLALRLEALSYFFAMLVLLVGAVIMVYSAGYLKEARPESFFVLMTGFAASMLLLVMADDLIVLFVAWELTTLCSYFLILRSPGESAPPATRTLLVTVGGGLCLLGAVAFIVARTGTTHLTTALTDPIWGQDAFFTGTVALLVALAAMTKSAQFPFHAWLPDAMVAPAPVSAYLHAAAMVKAGIFLLMLFAPATSQSQLWPWLLITIGLITTVMGGVFALQQHDLKKLLAYSTVSQLGMLVAIIGVGTPTAMTAATVHIVAHAAFKAACFMHIGLLEKRFGSRHINDLSGLWRTTPWDSAMIVIAAASMGGVLPTLGFVSKELVLEGMLHPELGGAGTGWLLAGILTFGAIFTVGYSTHMIINTLPGKADSEPKRAGTAPMMLAIAVMALSSLGLGLAVPVLDDLVRSVAAATTRVPVEETPYLALWHGVNAPLLLSLLALAAGLALGFLVKGNLEATARPLLPFTGVGVVQSLITGTIAFGRRVGDLTRTDSPAAHIGLSTLALIGASFLLPTLWRGIPGWDTVQPFDFVLLGTIIVGTVVAILSMTRLAALIALGLVGFSVTLWYYTLGAADVALTQLLVEILTVVIMVLAINRMGRRFVRTDSRARRGVAVVMAVLAGASATVVTLTFTGHRDMSEVSEYFLANVYEDTGGTNVVNTILVDYRALDTLGELVVLAVTALAIYALLQARPLARAPGARVRRSTLTNPVDNAIFLGSAGMLLQPIMIFGSIYVLLRGHNAPGGGFIGALVGASALALAYLSSSTGDSRWMRLPYLSIAGFGIMVAVATGFLGLIDGSFLRPIHVYLGGTHITSALVFDLGVYFAVFGVILAALRLLGRNPVSMMARDEADAVRELHEGLSPHERATEGLPVGPLPEPGVEADVTDDGEGVRRP